MAGDIAPVISLVALPRLAYPGMAITIDAVAVDNRDGAMPRRAATAVEPLAVAARRRVQSWHPLRRALFVAAQSARDASGAIRYRGDIVSQAQLTIDNIGRVLDAMGADLDDVVKLNTWFVGFGTDEDWRRAARVRSEAFRYPGPGATGVPVPRRYPDGGLVRQDCWAMRGLDGKPLPRSLSWPKGHWDWPMRVTFQQGVKVGKLIFLGGQYACDVEGKAQQPGDARSADAHHDGLHPRCPRGFRRDDGRPRDEQMLLLERRQPGGAARQSRDPLRLFNDPAAATTNVALKTMGLEGLMLEIEGIAILD